MKRSAICRLMIGMLLLLLLAPSQLVYAKEEHRYIIGFKEEVNVALIEQYGGEIEQLLPSIQAVAAQFPTEIDSNLLAERAIAYVEEDKPLSIHEQVIDWGVKSTNAPAVWQNGLTGKGVKVAIIDTGVDTNHPDLEITGGVSVVPYTPSYEDDNGHGTNVAGILAAKDNGIGIIGMAPDIELVVVKAFDEKGEGYHSHIIKGIEWAVSEDVDIINLSVGSKAYSIGLLLAVNDAYKKGVLVVAAAGNGGNQAGEGNQVEFPAAFDSVIAVAAIDKNGHRASFSATGPQVEVAAPGVKVITTALKGGYEYASGTSMAVPHVTGHLALLKEAYPHLPAIELRELLHQQTLANEGEDRNNELGYGIITLPNEFAIETKQVEAQTKQEQTFYHSSVSTFVVGQKITHPFGDGIFAIPITKTAEMLQRIR